ncbi:RNA polymerase sigma factor sigE, chloroplastic/mitochondrial isoform X1 [Zea mays]|uniref:RNA polymerase sigma factor sigE chloroplastic/mitochondrial n=1 Tax=Zea mays TaxID=4577 RepID=A0A1D6MEE6_MAIZE|nr:RNA polymerase sigma factor sigE, chloroplastic/mitochondrial isoform X1 [Zea mays]AQK89018.1 RNA polymerase sigma factor sigE chloroplastic/mitochondrial [Zea mays]|eukprot:XP_008650095.1 RNA polymerase sigma factor sigE, chloroplastic/mitochondrial isoform X1 [Zea mays]
MTSTVTTPSRPLAAGSRPRRSGPAVLSLSKGGGGQRRQRRLAPSTSCAVLASPDKQSTANKLPLSSRKQEEEVEKATDYNEVAAALETIYKLSPAVEVEEKKRQGGNEDDGGGEAKKKRKRRVAGRSTVVVRSRRRRGGRRMDLGKRVEMKGAAAASREQQQGGEEQGEREFEEMLLREHSVSTDMGSLDWKRMKIPPVLTSSQSARLFKTMQPMKAIFEAQESLREELQRDPTDAEVAEATGMTVHQLRRRLDVGRAARNKLIKHNLRLVPYALNKYYPDMGGDERFDELCQAGANGLITAIDRFEPKRGFRISTYALFWIRHSIVRAMTLSSFTRFPFAMESERQEIGRAREELAFELGRPPTDEEVRARVGLSPQRYRDVLRMARPTYSLHARNRVTQEELIGEVTDAEAVGVDAGGKHDALLRLAIDDLLDSLKPKESLVIRQRFGLDGRGRRTLSEVAGNLSISREMVRKYELKALMKLKHPTRVEYLRRYM